MATHQYQMTVPDSVESLREKLADLVLGKKPPEGEAEVETIAITGHELLGRSGWQLKNGPSLRFFRLHGFTIVTTGEKLYFRSTDRPTGDPILVEIFGERVCLTVERVI